MYVCEYVCVCMYMYVCMCVYMYGCTHACKSVSLSVCMYVCMQRSPACMYVCVSLCACMYVRNVRVYEYEYNWVSVGVASRDDNYGSIKHFKF